MSDMYSIIAKLCEQRGVKVGKMCSDIGISRGVLSDLNNGRTKSLSYKNMVKIANYFGTSVDVFNEGNLEEIKKPITSKDDELNEYLEQLRNRSEMRMLFKLAKGATKEHVEQAVKIIEALQK